MSLRPWYNKDANYQTNAKSFMDYLARTNHFLEVLIEDYEIFKELVNEELERIKFDSEMAVDDILTNWLDDGTLARIINDGVLGNKADKSEMEQVRNQLLHQIDLVNQNVLGLSNNLEHVKDGKVDKTGSMQIKWGNLAQDVRDQVLGTTPPAIVGTDSVGQSNIIDKSVTGSKIVDFKPRKYNLFNPEKALDNYRLMDDGTLLEDNEYSLSDFIPIDSNDGFRFNMRDGVSGRTNRLALYDSNKNFVKIIWRELEPFTRLGFDNAEEYNGFIRIDISKEHKYDFQVIYRQDEFKDGVHNFEPYSYEFENRFSQNIRQQLNIPENRNRLFFEHGYINPTTGDKEYTTTRVRTGLIKSSPYQFVRKINTALDHMIFTFDEHKNIISTTGSWESTPDYMKIKDPYFAVIAKHKEEQQINNFETYNTAFEANGNLTEGTEIKNNSTNEEKLSPQTRSKLNHVTGNFYSKRLLNFGDSIASGDGEQGYHRQIANMYDMHLHTYARGGATIIESAGGNNVIAQIQQAISDGVGADYILLNGLTNDSGIYTSERFGAITDGYDDNYDTSTFAGAFEYILKLLITTYKRANITYVRPHKTPTRDSRQKTLGDLAVAICEKWSIPVADIYTEGRMNTHIDYMVTDYCIENDAGTHPNTLGYQKFYVPKIIEKMK